MVRKQNMCIYTIPLNEIESFGVRCRVGGGGCVCICVQYPFLGEQLLTGGSPSSFCHIGVLGGFESTSHLSETSIFSLKGYPNPGKRDIAKDGVSKCRYAYAYTVHTHGI